MTCPRKRTKVAEYMANKRNPGFVLVEELLALVPVSIGVEHKKGFHLAVALALDGDLIAPSASTPEESFLADSDPIKFY